MQRRLTPILILVLASWALVGCDARQSYPPGYTDTDLWQGPPIRVDTEVPVQYPDGTTREAHLHDAIEDDAGH